MNLRASWGAQLKNYHFRSAQGRLAANQESENQLGNAANISARAEISKSGSLLVLSVSYKKRRPTSRRRIRVDDREQKRHTRYRKVKLRCRFKTYYLDKILLL